MCSTGEGASHDGSRQHHWRGGPWLHRVMQAQRPASLSWLMQSVAVPGIGLRTNLDIKARRGHGDADESADS